MLGSHEAQGPAMCAVDGCPQTASLVPYRVQLGPATFIWIRLCQWCIESVKRSKRVT